MPRDFCEHQIIFSSIIEVDAKDSKSKNYPIASWIC